MKVIGVVNLTKICLPKERWLEIVFLLKFGLLFGFCMSYVLTKRKKFDIMVVTAQELGCGWLMVRVRMGGRGLFSSKSVFSSPVQWLSD
ncbi:MAG: hypothetical protein LBQ02_00150 [Candidatus Nomurabacteria bacterium]|jgi:hypothetical protein|nr:hypothetical protein [Candidatus Nomurabacteria bacterium]